MTEEDYAGGDDVDVAARNAAVREAHEEAQVVLSGEDMVQIARWTPPPGPQKRFTTWFFICAANELSDVVIDQGEIEDHAWLNPKQALERHAKGEIDLAPPTWVTLHHLSMYTPAQAAFDHFNSQPMKIYSTHVAKRADGVRVAMWHGDAGYDGWDADAEGDRHRFVMAENGFIFENTVEQY